MVFNKLLIQRKYFFYILLLSAFYFLLSSCSTSPQSGSLSGTILLDGQEDHSNITVALYELAVLDPDIVAINEKYPHIGVIINQMTEFDHRFGNIVKYTQTDANGNFKIKDIPTSRYNVVAMKDSFGFKYIYNVQINNDDNLLYASRSTLYASRSSDLTLFPETYISSDIDTATIWQADHHYIIENDIFVLGSLTIKPGAVIRIEKDKKLTISGDLIAVGNEDNFIWFTSNDSLSFLPFTFYLLPLPPKEEFIPYTFNRVELTGSEAKQVRYCKFDHAGTGLLSRVNGFEIFDCIFRDSQCGFKAESVDSTFCSNLLCENITNEDGGIYFSSHIDGGDIKNNVCSNCVNGIKIYNHSNPEVKNNYIVNCNTGIDISFYSSPDVYNNEIVNCEQGFHISHLSYPQNYYNNIEASFCIYRGNYPGWFDFSINYNNLNCFNYAIYMKIISYPGHNSNINAKDNYFFTINEDKIKNIIHDKYDVEEQYQEFMGIVNYLPFLTQEYPYAGIQGE